MNIGADINNLLRVDATIISLVSRDKDSNPCIEVSNVEPKEAEWPVDGAGITIYQAGTDDKTMSYVDATWTVGCRASTYSASRTLSEAVITVLNRKTVSTGKAYCRQLATIQPADITDNYNTPVEVQVKRSL